MKPPRSGAGPSRALGLTLVAALLLPPAGSVDAQETDTLDAVSPGGAFLRSLAVPGWGHAAVGAYTRGGFYFLSSSAAGWMLFKTAHSLSAARDRVSLVEAQARRELEREGVVDPGAVQDSLELRPPVQDARDLVDVRSQQLEDWVSLGVFWLLISAADAYVSAHLAEFPEPVEVRALPLLPGRGAEIRIRVPLGGRR